MNRTPASALSRTARLAVAAIAVAAVAPVVAGGQAFAVPGLPELPDTLSGAVASVGTLFGHEAAATVVASGTPGVAQRATTLMVEHNCWTGEAPADVDRPGHAVVTVKQGDRMVTRYGGAQLTDRALGHVFGDADPQIFLVHGFCR